MENTAKAIDDWNLSNLAEEIAELDKEDLETKEENAESLENNLAVSNLNVYPHTILQKFLADRDVLEVRNIFKLKLNLDTENLEEFRELSFNRKLKFLDLAEILGYKKGKTTISDIFFNDADDSRALIVNTHDSNSQLYYSCRLKKWFSVRQILAKLTGYESKSSLAMFLEKVTNLPFSSSYQLYYLGAVHEAEMDFNELLKPVSQSNLNDLDFLTLAKKANSYLDKHNLKKLMNLLFTHARFVNPNESILKDTNSFAFFISAKQILDRAKADMGDDEQKGFKTPQQVVEKLKMLALAGFLNFKTDSEIRKDVLLAKSEHIEYQRSNCISFSQNMKVSVSKALNKLDSADSSVKALIKARAGFKVVKENESASKLANENAYLACLALKDFNFLSAKDLSFLLIRNNKNFRTGKNTKINEARIKNEVKYISTLDVLLKGVQNQKMTNTFKKEIQLKRGITLDFYRMSKIYYIENSQTFKLGFDSIQTALDFENKERIEDLYQIWKEEK